MTKEDIIQKLKRIVEPYVNHTENFNNLTETSDFIKDLEINSANLVDVILDIEDEFNIRIENDDMEQKLNVKKSVEVIEQKLK
ncbi:MAG: acyl carrier protein [Psychroflexus salarius]